MAVILLTIIESSEELIDGIPRSISMSTNIPATIFYTLDGFIPTTLSTVYVGGDLYFPTGGAFTFKTFATNGVDTSAIITRQYGPNIAGIRNIWDRVLNAPEIINTPDQFPYGDQQVSLPANYGDVGAEAVYTPGDVGYPDGYDGTGTGTPGGYTEHELSEYAIQYSESNWLGERGRGLGTLPSEVRITVTNPDNRRENVEISNVNDIIFDSRAKTIYHDSTTQTRNTDLTLINRPYFSLINSETFRDGATLQVIGVDYLITTGSLVTSRIDYVNKTITYYYFDSLALRWIVSTDSFDPEDDPMKDLGHITISSRPDMQRVYKWYPFMRRRLY